MNPVTTDKKSEAKSVFMTKYYNADEEYKRKHNTYMMEKVVCDCGLHVMRCNKTKHRASQKHVFVMKLYTKCTPAEIQKFLELSKL